jgi:hypothetical protein
MKSYYWLVLLLFLPFLSFSQKQEKGFVFADTISKYRPKYDYKEEVFAGTVIIKENPRKKLKNTSFDTVIIKKFDVTKNFNTLLDYNDPRIGKYIKVVRMGWRVQVYRGNDEAEASKVREKCYSIANTHNNYLGFNAPNYKVKIGDFIERQQAFKLYKQLKRRFPESVIVPDEVTVIKKADQDDIIEMQRREAQKSGNR